MFHYKMNLRRKYWWVGSLLQASSILISSSSNITLSIKLWRWSNSHLLYRATRWVLRGTLSRRYNLQLWSTTECSWPQKRFVRFCQPYHSITFDRKKWFSMRNWPTEMYNRKAWIKLICFSIKIYLRTSFICHLLKNTIRIGIEYNNACQVNNTFLLLFFLYSICL